MFSEDLFKFYKLDTMWKLEYRDYWNIFEQTVRVLWSALSLGWGWEVPLPSFRGGKVGGRSPCPASVMARWMRCATAQLPCQQGWQGGWEVPLPSSHGSKGARGRTKVGGRCHCPAFVVARWEGGAPAQLPWWQGGWEVPLSSFHGSKSGKVCGRCQCPASVVASPRVAKF